MIRNINKLLINNNNKNVIIRNYSIMSRYHGTNVNPIQHQLDLIEKKEERIREERAQPQKYKRVVRNYDITPPDLNSLPMTFSKPNNRKDSKTLNVAVIGAPNAGKSTLVNTIVGEKICAVSPTEHTTRDSILGIYTKDDTQILFHDTPGIIKNFNKTSHIREFVHLAWDVVKEADVVLLVVDATNNNSPDTNYIVGQLEDQMIQIIKEMRMEEMKKKQENGESPFDENHPDEKEFILVINKVDLVRKKDDLVQLISELNEGNIFTDTFVVSATSNIRVDSLTNYLLDKAKPGTWQFDETLATDQTDFFRASEIIKEKLYSKLKYEIPYQVVQSTIGWTIYRPSGDLRIDHDFIVTKASHKAMILGKDGSVIKSIYMEAKKDLEKIFNRKVHLFLSVKQKKSTEHYEIVGI